jgi:hypothetical protein
MAKKKRPSVRSKKTSTLADEAYRQTPDLFTFEEEPSMDGLTFDCFMTMLYGPVKIGKTTFASKLPNPYFLATEPGYKSLNVRKSKINNWVTFIKWITTMEKKPKKCATVGCWVIDTVDNLAKFCMQFICGRAGIAHPSDEEWGKGWEAFRDEWTHWILRLVNLGPGILFISHETEREVVYKGMKIPKTTPALPKTCYTVINNMADMILHMTIEEHKKKKGKKKKTKRVIYTKPDQYRDAGDRTGALPDRIYFDKEQEAVDAILGYFE